MIDFTLNGQPARLALATDYPLLDALRQGKIAGAALDVFTQEPLPADHPRGLRPTEKPTSSWFVGSEFLTGPTRHLPQTAMGWEINPEGLRHLLVRLGREYPTLPPLYITENGCGYNDEPVVGGEVLDLHRRDFLRNHLREAHRAVEAERIAVGLAQLEVHRNTALWREAVLSTS